MEGRGELQQSGEIKLSLHTHAVNKAVNSRDKEGRKGRVGHSDLGFDQLIENCQNFSNTNAFLLAQLVNQPEPKIDRREKSSFIIIDISSLLSNSLLIQPTFISAAHLDHGNPTLPLLHFFFHTKNQAVCAPQKMQHIYVLHQHLLAKNARLKLKPPNKMNVWEQEKKGFKMPFKYDTPLSSGLSPASDGSENDYCVLF